MFFLKNQSKILKQVKFTEILRLFLNTCYVIAAGYY